MDRVNRISAKIIADSKNEFGNRVSSFVLTYPRIIHAELLTHRQFSRNAASSRAIKSERMRELVKEEPFIPTRYQRDHAGMQGTEYFTHSSDIELIDAIWLQARNAALDHAEMLSKVGVTKQICNRLLEPFQMYQSIVTATEWENFVNLRVSPFAEDHFQDLSEKMLNALNESEPKQLKEGEWHIPFGDNFDSDKMYEWIHINIPSGQYSHPEDYSQREQELKVKLATVRCARISYLNQGKETPIEEDLKLHDRLASSGHYSAFEHCARAMSPKEFTGSQLHQIIDDYTGKNSWVQPGWCGNFRGFVQYRKMFPNENRTDSRLLKK